MKSFIVTITGAEGRVLRQFEVFGSHGRAQRAGFEAFDGTKGARRVTVEAA